MAPLNSNKKSNKGLQLNRRSVIIGTICIIIISAPITRISSVGVWIAMSAMILYLAYNSSFVSDNFKHWKQLDKSAKFRLTIWSIAAIITATTILKHDFLFFTSLVILSLDYILALSENKK